MQDENQEQSSISASNYDERPLEYYNDNQRLPVYTRKPRVLKPDEVADILLEEWDFLPNKVCTCQSLQIQHHCSFIVDLNSIKDSQDMKCDDLGVWKNNSSNKFTMDVSANEAIVLKREYFSLKDKIHDDVRKRIDTILREYNIYTLINSKRELARV